MDSANRIALRIVEGLLDDPDYEPSVAEMEYWGPLHDKLVARLRSKQPEPQGWRGIESAPKDGTGFDVWVKSTKNSDYGVRMTNVYYSQGVICGARYPDASFGEVATHWQPLPTPPKENSNG